jgi:hypothetical protein
MVVGKCGTTAVVAAPFTELKAVNSDKQKNPSQLVHRQVATTVSINLCNFCEEGDNKEKAGASAFRFLFSEEQNWKPVTQR